LLFFDDCIEHWQTSELIQRQKIEDGSVLLATAAGRIVSTQESVAPSAVGSGQLSLHAQMKEARQSEWWWAVQSSAIERIHPRLSACAPSVLPLELRTIGDGSSNNSAIVACMKPPVSPLSSEVQAEDSAHLEGWPQLLNQDWLQNYGHNQCRQSSILEDGTTSAGSAVATATAPITMHEILIPSPAAAVALRAAYPNATPDITSDANGDKSNSGQDNCSLGVSGSDESTNMALLCLRTGAERAIEVIVRRGPTRRRRQRQFQRRESKFIDANTGSYNGSSIGDNNRSNPEAARELEHILKERSSLSEAERARVQIILGAFGGKVRPLSTSHDTEMRSESSKQECVWEVHVDEV